MFMGEYNHTVDPKGRLIVPSKFREQLGSEFVVTKGLDGCLFVYPAEEWQPSFGELSKSVARQLGKHKPISIPYWMAWCMAKIGDMFGSKAPINSYKLDKMTKSLTFSNKKACKELKWEPLDVLKNLKTEK